MLDALTIRLRGALLDHQPWTNVYGLARTILATCTAGTLLANPAWLIFRPVAGLDPPPNCAQALKASAFCLSPNHLDLVRLACVVGLAVVASGWRPRYTGLLHWWISFSLQSAMVTDGGDQLTAVLTLLLLPVTLTDPRSSHWAPPPSAPRTHARLTASWAHVLIRLQMAGLYYHAAAGKLTVQEWRDGTAMWYWGTHEMFGSPPWIDRFLHPVMVHGWTVAIFTWSVVLLEFCLAFAFLVRPTHQRAFMIAGMIMHTGIVFVHGLPSFGLAMDAALLLYLRPWSSPFSLRVPRLFLRPIAMKGTTT